MLLLCYITTGTLGRPNLLPYSITTISLHNTFTLTINNLSTDTGTRSFLILGRTTWTGQKKNWVRVTRAGAMETFMRTTAGLSCSPSTCPSQVSLRLRFKGILLYTNRVLCNMECCIRQLWCSSVMLYNITSIAYNHYTDIYPLLNI